MFMSQEFDEEKVHYHDVQEVPDLLNELTLYRKILPAVFSSADDDSIMYLNSVVVLFCYPSVCWQRRLFAAQMFS